jgi:hypothetical protein
MPVSDLARIELPDRALGGLAAKLGGGVEIDIRLLESPSWSRSIDVPSPAITDTPRPNRLPT